MISLYVKATDYHQCWSSTGTINTLTSGLIAIRLMRKWKRFTLEVTLSEKILLFWEIGNWMDWKLCAKPPTQKPQNTQRYC